MSRRTLGGLPTLGWHLLQAFALVPGWLLRPSPQRDRERLFFQRCLRAIGVELEVEGAAEAGPSVLYVANHISFTDVLALAWLLDADFVAKSDVRRWSLFGRWAERIGTVFIERARRHATGDQVALLARTLESGRSLVIFPEGTTSDGSSVLPFRSSLLAAAGGARVIQPIALSYSDGARRGYIGEESLGANLLRLAPHRTRLRVQFLPVLSATTNRKQLAAEARNRISLARAPYRSVRGQPDHGGATTPEGSAPT